MKNNRVSKKFKPDKCSYRLGRINYSVQPRNTTLKYWQRIDTEYIGILKRDIYLPQILVIILFIFTIHTKLCVERSGIKEVSIQVQDIMYLEDDKLSVGINSRYLNGNYVNYVITVNGIVLTSGLLKAGGSIGVVDCDVKLKEGNHQAKVKFILKDDNKLIEESSKNILIISQ